MKYQSQVADLRDLYDAILAQAQTENPIEPATGKRGRPKQSKATNLIGRLRNYSDDVWRFTTQLNVPFTNNLAEQTVRMPKVKQKVRLLSEHRKVPRTTSSAPIAPPCTSKGQHLLSPSSLPSRVHPSAKLRLNPIYLPKLA
ncbi:MAG: transposase [Comamonadaceae bacterium]|nr:transposase [Comamonadaceae bacterium]